MRTHVVELTKQRLSDFFVKEEGHVAHKNALVAGTVATGAIFASMLLAPDTAEAQHFQCGPDGSLCSVKYEVCCSHYCGDEVYFYCNPKEHGC